MPFRSIQSKETVPFRSNQSRGSMSFRSNHSRGSVPFQSSDAVGHFVLIQYSNGGTRGLCMSSASTPTPEGREGEPLMYLCLFYYIRTPERRARINLSFIMDGYNAPV